MVEGPGDRAFLESFLPRLLGTGQQTLVIQHEGKKDLEQSVPRKLRAWHRRDDRFVILRDRDSEDCLILKQRLVNICKKSGKPDSVVRVACPCLEAWFLGDLGAVAKALALPAVAGLSQKAKFRDPDRLSNAVDELRKVIGTYQKIGHARAIGTALDPESNKSKSFKVFVTAIQKLV